MRLNDVLRALRSPLREALLRRSISIADQNSKFRAGQPTIWGSLRNLAEWFRPAGIIDVGANVGAWATEASQIFACPIHMIEAQRSLEPQLRSTGFPYTICLLGPESRASTGFCISGTRSSVTCERTGPACATERHPNASGGCECVMPLGCPPTDPGDRSHMMIRPRPRHRSDASGPRVRGASAFGTSGKSFSSDTLPDRRRRGSSNGDDQLSSTRYASGDP